MIGLIAATRLETDPLISLLGLSAELSDPFPVFQSHDVRLIISGVGKVNAAMAAAYLILRAPMKCVCNLGAAGQRAIAGHWESACMSPASSSPTGSIPPQPGPGSMTSRPWRASPP